jgi:hypothetical protein
MLLCFISCSHFTLTNIFEVRTRMFQTMTNSTRTTQSPWFSVVLYTVVELGYRASRYVTQHFVVDVFQVRESDFTHRNTGFILILTSVTLYLLSYQRLWCRNVEGLCFTAAVRMPFWAMHWSRYCMIIDEVFIIVLAYYVLTYIRNYLLTYVFTYLSTYLVLTFIRTYLLTCLLSYLLTYLLT